MYMLTTDTHSFITADHILSLNHRTYNHERWTLYTYKDIGKNISFPIL